MIVSILAHGVALLHAAGLTATTTPLPQGGSATGAASGTEQGVVLDPLLKAFIRWLIFFANGVGAVVIGVAAVRGFIVYLVDLLLHGGRAVPKEIIRLSLGRSLALALEFQLGADILGTALDPTTKDLVVLGTIVILRTVLNFFLGRELAEEQRIVGSAEVGSRAAGFASWLLPRSAVRDAGSPTTRRAPPGHGRGETEEPTSR